MAEGDRFDAGKERRIVGVLAICFGLVGLDRFIINPLFPTIAADIGLSYRDIGLVAGFLALTWGIAAFVSGRLADRIGVKLVLVASLVAFSSFVGFGAAATGLVSLMLVRALLGFAEGTFVPACIVATTRVSKPSRLGFNIGLQHLAAAVFGLGLAPLMATQLLGVLPSWQWVFVIAAVPGFIMVYWVQRVVPPDTAFAAQAGGLGSRWSVLKRPQIAANALAMSCWLSSITTLGALLPSYLTDYRHLGLGELGIVLSAQGLGSVVGWLLVPALGDRYGYRALVLAATALKLIVLVALGTVATGTGFLFAVLFMIGLTGSGVMAITVGPLTSRAVASGEATTATGVVVGVGEILGGAISPVVAGLLATRFGISIVPFFALGAVALGLLATAWPARSREWAPG